MPSLARIDPDGDTNVKDLRLEVRTRNNVLWHAIYDVCPSVAEFCRRFDLKQEEVGLFLNLKKSPYAKNGEPRSTALKLCEVTGFGISHLFPMRLYYRIEPKRRLVAEVSSAKMLSLDDVSRSLAYQANQEDVVSARELQGAIKRVLKTITPREQKVIIRRFGLVERERTLEEIAVEHGVTKGRIKQIEDKALRKLRHPSRTKHLEPFLSDWITEDEAPNEIPVTAHPQQPDTRAKMVSPVRQSDGDERVFLLVRGWADRTIAYLGSSQVTIERCRWEAVCLVDRDDLRSAKWAPEDAPPPNGATNVTRDHVFARTI